MRTGRSRWGSLRVRYRCLLSVFFADSGKEVHVRLDVLLVVKIWFQPRRKLTGEHFLVIAVQVACRDSVGLAFDDLLDRVIG